MIDNWFKKDIDKILGNHSIAVFVDESSEASFLLEKLKDEATIYKVANEVEELKAKYEIEKSNGNGEKYIIYTSTTKNTFIRKGSADQRATKEEIDTLYRDQTFGTKTSEIATSTSIKDLNHKSISE